MTPKSRLGLGLESLRLESNSRHCSDVTKAHRCCKYVMIFDKNRLFVRFFSHSTVITLFKFAISHSIIEPWQSLCVAIQKPGHRIKFSKNYRPVRGVYEKF